MLTTLYLPVNPGDTMLDSVFVQREYALADIPSNDERQVRDSEDKYGVPRFAHGLLVDGQSATWATMSG